MINKSEEIINTISKILGVKKEEIKGDSRLIEDLGADSLDIAELILNIEDQFNIKISEDEVGKFKTVKDVIDYFDHG
ncbi:MAG: acyl carrier protein [Candidatus Omnitrophica bacterium]|nr:acyl carrier protein [Candidatus Omnitrophota bacterium]